MSEEIQRRLDALENELPSVRAALETNTQITQLTKADTAALLEFIETVKVLRTIGRWASRVVQWLAPPAAALAAVWAAIKTGKHP